MACNCISEGGLHGPRRQALVAGRFVPLSASIISINVAVLWPLDAADGLADTSAEKPVYFGQSTSKQIFHKVLSLRNECVNVIPALKFICSKPVTTLSEASAN